MSLTSNSPLAASDSNEVGALPVRVITPHNGLDAFKDAYRSIIRDWPITRALAYRMFVRDTAAAYRESFLGYIWLVLPALASTLVWVFLNGQNVVDIDSGDTPYPLFVFTGTALWTAFNIAIVGTLQIVGAARGTLSKVNFPHEALVLTAFGKSLLNTIVTAVFVFPFLFFFPVELSAKALLFPLGLLAMIILGTAIGLAVVPIAALFNDLTRAIHLGLRFAFFLTPVIYPLPTDGIGRTVFLLNPVTPILVTSRHWLTGGETPALLGFLVVTFISMLLLSLALIIFKVAMPHLIERLGV
jgi:lipopolysaccharide transport system permease protein